MSSTATTKRASKEQVQARVAELTRILLDGALNMDVLEFVREKEREAESLWFVPDGGEPLGYSQIRRYIEKSERAIAATCEKDRGKLLHRHLGQRRRLYQTAVSQGDVKAALSVLQDEAELLGLYPVKKAALAGSDAGAFPSLSVLVQTLIQAEGANVTVTQSEPQRMPLAIIGDTEHERNPAGDQQALAGSQALP